METNISLVATAVVALVLLMIWQRVRSRGASQIQLLQQKRQRIDDNNGNKPALDNHAYNDIEPLHDFDWSTTPPVTIRPFKPKFHLTMGLENCPLSHLLAVDKTYVDRIRLRKKILDENQQETYQCNGACTPAVLELYSWLFGVYLPKRFPTMYKLRGLSDGTEKSDNDSEEQNSTHLFNTVTQTDIPLTPSSPEEALYTISANIDTDFLFLLPSSTDATGAPIYHLEAFTCCFPAGFSLPQKMSLPLAGIHKPVPGYAAKLEKSMDRFFAKLETGRAVKRFNWGVTTNDKLFTQGGNHLYADGSTAQHQQQKQGKRQEASQGVTENAKTLDVTNKDIEAVIEAQKKDVRVEDCRLRCERQTLHRLPRSGALVFAFKTYLYPLAEVKAEGNGEVLAEAIDGLQKGSVPEMQFYKRGVVWGDKVKEYLRS